MLNKNLKKILIYLHKYRLVIYFGFIQAIKVWVYKIYKSELLSRIFTKSNVSKVLIIFTVGLISRIAIGFYYDVNVFREYYKTLSLIYYWSMAMFIVVLGELFTYFNFNILPPFIFEYYTLLYNFTLHIAKTIGQINNSIYHFVWNKKISDLLAFFKIKSIINLFNQNNNNNNNNNNKLYLAQNLPELDNSKSIISTTFKISNISNKNKDDFLLPKTTYKPGSTSVATPPPSVNEVNNISRPSLISSGVSVPIGISPNDLEGDNRLSASNIRDQLRSSSIYSQPTPPVRPSSIQDEIKEINTMLDDFSLYGHSQSSSLNTPTTLPPLFNKNIVEDNSSISSKVEIEGQIKERKPSNIDYSYGPFNPNENLVTRDPPKMFKERCCSDSSLYYTEELKKEDGQYDKPYYYPAPPKNTPASSINSDNNALYSSVRIVNKPKLETIIPRSAITNTSSSTSVYDSFYRTSQPYPLSANAKLPNIGFSEVGNVISSIPLSNVNYNNRLPFMPYNHETSLDSTIARNDPCSIHYKSRHRHLSSIYWNRPRHPIIDGRLRSNENNYYNTDIAVINQEVNIKKPGIRGKIKLGFKTLGSKFSNGVHKVESVYISYESKGKRKILWKLFEENSGKYESYEDFKKSWDNKASLWKEIKKHTKNDMKALIEDIMGISNNNPTIGNNVTREVEGIIHNRRPFTSTLPRDIEIRHTRGIGLNNKHNARNLVDNNIRSNTLVSQEEGVEYEII